MSERLRRPVRDFEGLGGDSKRFRVRIFLEADRFAVADGPEHGGVGGEATARLTIAAFVVDQRHDAVALCDQLTDIENRKIEAALQVFEEAADLFETQA